MSKLFKTDKVSEKLENLFPYKGSSGQKYQVNKGNSQKYHF